MIWRMSLRHHTPSQCEYEHPRHRILIIGGHISASNIFLCSTTCWSYMHASQITIHEMMYVGMESFKPNSHKRKMYKCNTRNVCNIMKCYKEIQLKFIHSLFQFYSSLLLSYRKQLAYSGVVIGTMWRWGCCVWVAVCVWWRRKWSKNKRKNKYFLFHLKFISRAILVFNAF